MCKSNNPSKMDKCMNNIIAFINNHTEYDTYGCCCGHGKYPMTIIVGIDEIRYEIVSGIFIHRKTRFYKKDEEGYYYIPEVLEKGEK